MKMSRRELAFSAAAFRQTAETKPYRGALDKFESPVDLKTFDPVAWTQARYMEMPRRLRFSARNANEVRSWQKKLRTKVAELLGGFPSARPTVKATILETRDFPTFTREALMFESRPGLSVFGYLLKPKNVSAPPPVTICIPGHGRGVDDIVGVNEKGGDRIKKVGYQFDFAIQAVEQGMAAFAIEPLGFGCRRGDEAKKKGLGQSSCQPAAGAAFLFGETMIGWRVFDIMRSIDYLETRTDIDPKRVGCMGISGGGTITLFGAAMDERIKACLISGYLCTFYASILSVAHCIDNYVPGILQWAEMNDVAGLIAPRPLFAESGDVDNIFPLEATKKAFGEVKRVYDTLGAGDRCAHEVFAGPHEFHGVGGLKFLGTHLRT
ncbi:MAG TPA: alpha/beta hydrolase family protein [Bryobacteraceae bacterium]|nr:alpha/beta hydrolase family protein [Bryobacteraceae bacterium]HPT26520.1 alpha/beta hydrolase family protein [Bryobacteraceae bacterium]